MRPSVFLAAIPLVFGCAQQSVVPAPPLPSDEPLEVRLHQPGAGALKYTLSEPGYIAIFAVTRGHGISILFPYYASQADHRSHAGLNQETVHGGSGAWGYSVSARNEHRALFGYADAYYIIASKHPLPVEGILQSPFLLRSLIGADVFRATNLTDTWAALEEVLVGGLPDDSWASDVYLNWRDPFMTTSFALPEIMGYCHDRSGFYAVSAFYENRCSQNPNLASTAPVSIAEGLRHAPPKEPRDREPSLPAQPRASADDAAARTSRARPIELSRHAERERSPVREQAPAPSRPVEPRPQSQQQPARTESRKPEPQPDNS